MNGKNRPLLRDAEVTCGSRLLSGSVATVPAILGKQTEISLPVVIGVVALLMFLASIMLVPSGQLPSGWWAVLQLLVPAVCAFAIAAVQVRRKPILWRIS
jgi:hypothetical protein